MVTGTGDNVGGSLSFVTERVGVFKYKCTKTYMLVKCVSLFISEGIWLIAFTSR